MHTINTCQFTACLDLLLRKLIANDRWLISGRLIYGLISPGVDRSSLTVKPRRYTRVVGASDHWYSDPSWPWITTQVIGDPPTQPSPIWVGCLQVCLNSWMAGCITWIRAQMPGYRVPLFCPCRWCCCCYGRGRKVFLVATSVYHVFSLQLLIDWRILNLLYNITLHYIVYIIHCTMYSKQCTLYTVQCTVYTITIYCPLYNVHHIL